MVSKDEMKESVRLLHKMGFNLFGSYNTADYFNEVFKDQNIVVEHVEWAYENIGEDQEVFHVYTMAKMTSIKGSFLAFGGRSQLWKLNNS